jgi:hypothetical protein
MKLRKPHVSLAFRLWLLATVLIVFFLEGFVLLGWLAAGALLGLAWHVLPEEPEPPVEPLPYQHLYADRQVPRRDE